MDWKCLLVFMALPFVTPAFAGVHEDQCNDLFEKHSDGAYEVCLPLAKAGDADAQFKVALLSCDANATRCVEGEKWMKKSAKGGNPEAQFFYASKVLASNPDKSIGEKWMEKSAIGGNPAAQYFYASKLMSMGTKNETVKGLEMMIKSSRQGNPNASVFLANAYMSGSGVKPDSGQGFAWFIKAAEQNDPMAQFFVGISYLTGNLVRQDE